MYNLPNFLCVGAQKSGTTTLHDILKQHPSIFLPNIKETKFFQKDDEFSKGIDYYAKYFEDKIGLAGEIDPDYMCFEYVPKRIFETLGSSAKIIFLLRDPVDRAYSHYLMSKRRGFEKLSFSDAVLVEKERLMIDDSQLDFYKSKTLNFSYINRGFYSNQIKEYLKYFDIENMMFILFEEDLIKNREQTIKKVLNFIGVDETVRLDFDVKSNVKARYRSRHIAGLLNRPHYIKNIFKYFIPNRFLFFMRNLLMKANTNNNTEPLSEEEKKNYLDEYFTLEISELEKIIGRKTHWKKWE